MTVLEVLRAARARIEDPSRWCQGQGQDEAGRMCAFGATYAVTHGEGVPSLYAETVADRSLVAAAQRLFGKHVVDVNDQLGHAAILLVFDAAIADEESRS